MLPRAELLRVKGELLLLQGAPGAAAVAEDHFRQTLDLARRQGVEPDRSSLGSTGRHGPVAISVLILRRSLHAFSLSSQSWAPFCPLSKHHFSAVAGCA